MEQAIVYAEAGKVLEEVRGCPRQVFLKCGEKRIGSVLVWKENPGKDIRLNALGKYWVKCLLRLE